MVPRLGESAGPVLRLREPHQDGERLQRLHAGARLRRPDQEGSVGVAARGQPAAAAAAAAGSGGGKGGRGAGASPLDVRHGLTAPGPRALHVERRRRGAMRPPHQGGGLRVVPPGRRRQAGIRG